MYPIWIWTDKYGTPHIGADGRETAVDGQQVFGCQIGHRVTAETPDGWRIMTPTEAKKRGFTRCYEFSGPKR